MQREPTRIEQQELVQRLRAVLQAGGAPVQLFETHISWVLVAGSEAYKIKKALRLDFLDFSSLAARRHCCEEEVRLNQRLAPQIYLGVIPITGTLARPQLGGEGEALEFAVRMRAFAQQCLWTERIAAGLLGDGEIDRLARLLAAFHGSAARAASDRPWGAPELLRKLAEENLAMLLELAEPARHGVIGVLRDWQQACLRALAPVFASRKAAGWVRECHGDLHCGNILTVDGEVAPFDCIEFSDALRWLDVMHDLAFACMDLRQLGRGRQAARLLNGYLEASGDYAGLAVLRFYEVDSALVRANVALLRSRQVDGAAAQALRQRAGVLLDTALATSRPAPPALIVMHGLSGSGKSSIARQVAELLPALQLRSDVERKRMQAIAPHAMYDQASTEAVYARLRALAEIIVKSGHGVIVDACNLKRGERDAFLALGEALGVPVPIIDVRASDAVLRQRIRARQAQGGDPSDADEAVLDLQRRGSEPLTDAERARALCIDSETALEPQRWRAWLERCAGAPG
jgi:hypothetical protein